ncbi:MAG: hypothetical protein Q8N23_04080 [Archangium sp.]|nr:hypothetical protein [Archangium sp.]MDP3569864.1 hypothetical protein [Archangium sp.]
MFRRLVLLLSLSLLACGPVPPLPDGGTVDSGVMLTDGGLDLNDVSWLLPLPHPGQQSLLLGFTSAGSKGPLFPRRLYDVLPGLVESQDAAAMFPSWRVISARIDPCFPKEPAGCIKQLRLVAQPIVVEALATTTEDGTIHLFYELTDAEFESARGSLAELKRLAGGVTNGKPLDVHPVMRAEGLAGPYASALHAMISRLCGEQNLTRVAFMRLVQKDVAWRFGALNLVSGMLAADPIPRLSNLTQQGVQEFGNTEFRSGELQPAAIGDDLSVLLSESEMRLTDARTLDRAVTSALRIEHPARSNPLTVDCGSCHVASRALRNARAERTIDTSAHADRYVGNPRFDLRLVDAAGDDPRAMRAFGYFGAQSAFSLRTINESAEVAEALSR